MRVSHLGISKDRIAQLDADFAQFDGNGDGSISLDEFIKVMMLPVNGVMPDWEEAVLVDMFAEMDHDGSGCVCYHEFAQAWAIEPPAAH